MIFIVAQIHRKTQCISGFYATFMEIFLQKPDCTAKIRPKMRSFQMDSLFYSMQRIKSLRFSPKKIREICSIQTVRNLI